MRIRPNRIPKIGDRYLRHTIDTIYQIVGETENDWILEYHSNNYKGEIFKTSIRKWILKERLEVKDWELLK